MFSFLLRIRVNGKVLKPARGKRLRADGRQPFPYRHTEGRPVIDPESRIGLRNRRTTWRLAIGGVSAPPPSGYTPQPKEFHRAAGKKTLSSLQSWLPF